MTAGVLAMHALAELPSWPVLAALSAPALLPWRWRAPWALFALGVLATCWQAEVRLGQRWPPQRHGEEQLLRGRIASLPETAAALRSEAGEHSWRFQFAAEEPAFPPLIRASWYRSGQTPRAGECWQLRLRLRSPHGSLNPGGFDYEAWLWQRGIGATATVLDGQPCPQPATAGLLTLRQTLRERIGTWLPGHPGLPLVLALSLGDDSALESRDWDALRYTGTAHLVAVSGFNIAIVSGLVFFLLRWTWACVPTLALRWPAQKAAWIGAALGAVGYALLAGWEAPVARAAWMLAMFSVAALGERLGQPSRVLALAWTLLLLADPSTILSPGLWLSFGAVAIIFLVATTEPQHRRSRWLQLCVQALRLQLALSLLLAPLALFFFHGVSWLSLPVNLVAVPLVSVLTPLLLCSLMLAWVWPGVGVPALGLCASALDQLREGLVWLASALPLGWFAAAAPTAALILAGLGLLLLWAPRGLPLRPLACICLLAVFLPQRADPPGGLELTVLDVGQGLSVVLRTQQHTLVYDAGPAYEDGFDAGESVLVPFLLERGVRRVDRFVLSHNDLDHAGGLPALRRALPVVEEIGTPRGIRCRAGLSWTWEGVRFLVLHPREGSAAGSDNEDSCVLRVEGAFSALLPGDIEAAAERVLLGSAAPLAADLLVAPHHGSASSSTPGFVAAVGARLVAFSAGWRNRFRHPRPEVLTRYADCGAALFQTGEQGALRFSPGAEGRIDVQVYRLGGRRFWNARADAGWARLRGVVPRAEDCARTPN